MDNWEKELREKLEKEIPDGTVMFYENDGISLATGKGGIIEFEVQMRKMAQGYLGSHGHSPDKVFTKGVIHEDNTGLTMEKLRNAINDLEFKFPKITFYTPDEQ